MSKKHRPIQSPDDRDSKQWRSDLVQPWRECLFLINAIFAYLVSVAAIETMLHGCFVYFERVLKIHLPAWLEPTLLLILALVLGCTALMCGFKHICELVRFLLDRHKPE